MSFKTNGTVFKKFTRSKFQWIKIALGFILSNLAFYHLFCSTPIETPKKKLRPGWVTVQVHAELMTNYKEGEKVFLFERNKHLLFEAILDEAGTQDDKFTLLIEESNLPIIYQSDHWQIIPFSKRFLISKKSNKVGHEIYY
jgi:hypothetical protein